MPTHLILVVLFCFCFFICKLIKLFNAKVIREVVEQVQNSRPILTSVFYIHKWCQREEVIKIAKEDSNLKLLLK